MPAAQVPSPRRRGLTGLVVVALLAGGVSGAGTVAALEQTGGPRPAIVQQRGPAGVGAAAAGSVEAAAQTILPSVVQVRAGGGSGSGVIMDDRGHVLTNHHVVAGADQVILVLSTGPARVVREWVVPEGSRRRGIAEGARVAAGFT